MSDDFAIALLSEMKARPTSRTKVVNKSGRLGGNFLEPEKIAAIVAYLREGWTTRRIEAALGVSKNTILRYRKVIMDRFAERAIHFCLCGRRAGHRGWCSVRFKSSDARQAFWKGYWSRFVRKERPEKPERGARLLNYPYLPYAGSRSEGANLVLLVNSCVPYGLQEADRADLCQELLCALVAGEIDETQVKQSIRPYLTKLRKLLCDFAAISLDTPRSEGASLHDVLADVSTSVAEDETDFHASYWRRVA